jgi:hypothetical protein
VCSNIREQETVFLWAWDVPFTKKKDVFSRMGGSIRYFRAKKKAAVSGRLEVVCNP